MRRLFAILAICALTASCAYENDIDFAAGRLSFSADSFDFGMSRTGVDTDGNFIWSANDTVGVCPDSGSQIYFEMTSGAGAGTAEFDSGWLLKAGHTYLSYYPFRGDIYLDPASIPVSFTGQHQSFDGDAADFAGYDYMYSDPVSGDAGKLHFQYHHLGSLLRFKATLPAGKYALMRVETDGDFFAASGSYDLTASAPAIEPSQNASSLEVRLDGFDFSASKNVTVYAVTAPVDLSGHKLRVCFQDADGNVLYQYTADVKSAFTAGGGFEIAQPASSRFYLRVTHKLKTFIVPKVPGATFVLWGDDMEDTYEEGISYTYGVQKEYEVSLMGSKSSTFEFDNIIGIRKIDLSEF